MSQPSINLTFDTLGNVPRTSAALRSNQDVVYIDVGSRKINSNVVRDGVPIGVYEVDPDVLRSVIIDRPAVSFRVVSQSVPPGTAVPQGTTINVTLARPGGLPIGIVTGVHQDLAQMTVGEAFPQFINATTRRIIARAAEGPLSATDEQAIRDTFTGQHIPVTDQPGQDVDAALQTLRMLSAFGGS